MQKWANKSGFSHRLSLRPSFPGIFSGVITGNAWLRPDPLTDICRLAHFVSVKTHLFMQNAHFTMEIKYCIMFLYGVKNPVKHV